MRDDRTRVAELRELVRRFVDARDWGKYHSPKNLAMSISIEASELMELFQWCTVEEAGRVRGTEEMARVREEIADVLIYCFSLANQLDIDLASAVSEKMDQNARRFPESGGSS